MQLNFEDPSWKTGIDFAIPEKKEAQSESLLLSEYVSCSNSSIISASYTG
jgi:hypothetical protein